MAFPRVIKDPEMGEVEWIFKDTSKEDVARINGYVQEKIDFIDSDSTKEFQKSIEIKEPEPKYVEELQREKSLRKQAEEKAALTQKNLDTLIDKVLQENEVDEPGTGTVRETTNTDESTEE